MCLAEVVRLLEVDSVAGSGVAESGSRHVEVSLAPLVLAGERPAPGDWVVVHTGLAVELLEESEVERIRRDRYEVLGDESVPVGDRPAQGGDVEDSSGEVAVGPGDAAAVPDDVAPVPGGRVGSRVEQGGR